jgi:hypothetical protein
VGRQVDSLKALQEPHSAIRMANSFALLPTSETWKYADVTNRWYMFDRKYDQRSQQALGVVDTEDIPEL